MGSNPPQGGGGGTIINALSDVEDVTVTSNSSGEILKWNGSAWVNQTLTETGIQGTLSNAAIKTAYEANSDTNEFSDAEQTKLAGIAASANNYTHTTNANLTGDVTSVGNATTIAVDAVDIPMLSATGTASSTTFLRGDNTWGSAGGGAHTIQDWTLQSSTPADPATDTGRMYMKDIDSNNEGLFMKVKKNGTVSEVQIL